MLHHTIEARLGSVLHFCAEQSPEIHLYAERRCGSSRDGAVFGSHAYSASDLGTMKATVRQGLVNPYLGVGFSTEILPHLTFSGDAGMLFTGAVHSSLNWSGSSTLPASFAAEYNSKIGSVRSDFRSKTHSFEYYPVVMLGLGYRF